MEARSDGGEADSEHIEVAVIPHGRPAPSRYVMMATVVACLRNAWRNSSASPSSSIDCGSSLGIVAGPFVVERGR